MNSNFDKDGSAKANNQSAPKQSIPDALDNLKRDRFELLSAYLDGEVTAFEKRQVEQWLATDNTARCMYLRLRKLRHGLRTMPVPATSQVSVEDTIEAVCKKVDRRPQMALAVVGTAITVLAASFIPGNPLRVQFANFLKEAPERPAESLKLNLNTPVLPYGSAESGSTAEASSTALDISLEQAILPIPHQAHN